RISHQVAVLRVEVHDREQLPASRAYADELHGEWHKPFHGELDRLPLEPVEPAQNLDDLLDVLHGKHSYQVPMTRCGAVPPHRDPEGCCGWQLPGESPGRSPGACT